MKIKWIKHKFYLRSQSLYLKLYMEKLVEELLEFFNTSREKRILDQISLQIGLKLLIYPGRTISEKMRDSSTIWLKIRLFNLEFQHAIGLYTKWHESLKDFKECPICYTLSNQNQLLGCGHNLCLSCFKQILKQLSSSHHSRYLQKCPMCRSNIQNIEQEIYKHIIKPLLSNTENNIRYASIMRHISESTPDQLESPIGQPITAASLYEFHRMGRLLV